MVETVGCTERGMQRGEAFGISVIELAEAVLSPINFDNSNPIDSGPISDY